MQVRLPFPNEGQVADRGDGQQPVLPLGVVEATVLAAKLGARAVEIARGHA